jgi:hypothetical protein
MDTVLIPSDFFPTRSCSCTEIDSVCMLLFDDWCERRAVLLLTYLMHAWPFVSPSRQAAEHLILTLQDILRYHDDSLTARDHELIARVVGVSQ